MTLCPFSIAEHVPLLLSGEKQQTTRPPGRYKVGDTLHCWYKPRQKKTCRNCIIQECKTKFVLHDQADHQLSVSTCSDHRNFFGKAKITDIQHHYTVWPENHRDLVVGGYYALFGNMPKEALEKWARADGFSDLQEAHKFFSKWNKKSYLWMFQSWDVIIFEPEWVIPTVDEFFLYGIRRKYDILPEFPLKQKERFCPSMKRVTWTKEDKEEQITDR